MRVIWQLMGLVRVVDTFMPGADGNPINRPLNGIEVLLESSTWGVWGRVDTLRTDAEGRFHFTVNMNESAKRFRIRVRFRGDNLQVGFAPYDVARTDWSTIFDTGARTEQRVIDAGELLFREGAAGDLGVWNRVMHARYWAWTDTVMRRLREQDARLGFIRPIRVFSPVIGTASYAIANTANIIAAQADPATLFHEIMHLWDAQHTTGGEIQAVADAVFDTNGALRDPPQDAFREGVAVYFEFMIMEIVFGQPTRPLRARGGFPGDELTIATLDDVQRNSAYVLNILRHMTFLNPEQFVLGPREGGVLDVVRDTSINVRGLLPQILTFWDVLASFVEHPDRGVAEPWNGNNAQNGLWAFLARAALVSPTFTERHIELFRQVYNPATELELHELLTREGRRPLDVA